MPTSQEVRAYCERFQITFVEAPNEPLDDPHEWDGVVCAGFMTWTCRRTRCKRKTNGGTVGACTEFP